MKSVCVFCGSNSGTLDAYEAAADATGAAIARRGLRLVYGGAHVGLMGAVADAALAAGGDRVSRWRDVESELDRLKEELDVQLQEIREATDNVFSDSAAEEELWGRNLVSKVLELFQEEPDQSEGVLRLEKTVISLVSEELASFRRSSSATQLLEAQNEIARLERRVSKLSEGLGRTEEELRRIASLKDVDLGVASIYRTVQGLQVDDGNYEAKKEMLKNIFDANLALRAEMAK